MTSMPPKIQAKVHPTNITNYQHCQNFTISMLPKSKPKLIQQTSQITNIAKTSQFLCPNNPSKKSSNNITNYQHCRNSISHQHCPHYTMTKRYNISKMLQSQHYNMINHTMPQIPTRSHNTMTMSQHQIFNSKSQILNSTSKFSHPKFPIPNFQTPNFLGPNFPFQIFKFQISNFQFQISKFQIANSKH